MTRMTNVFIFVVAHLVMATLISAASVNVLIITEDDADIVAGQTVQAGLDVLSKNNSAGVVVTRQIVDISKINDTVKALEKVCAVYDAMVAANKPPDLVLDTSLAGDNSDEIKMLFRSLGVPSVAMSYGGVNQVEPFYDLTREQDQYVLQIRPPGDVILPAIRTLVTSQNLTTITLIFDKSFVMDYHFTFLLINVPVRQMYRQFPEDIDALLMKQKELQAGNIFLFATGENVEKFMRVVCTKGRIGRQFTYHIVSRDDIRDFKFPCDGVNAVLVRPSPLRAPGNGLQTFRQMTGLKVMPDIDVAFYHDVAVTAVKAVSNMKESRTWPVNMTYTKCADFSENNAVIRKNLDLKAAMRAVNLPPMYGPLFINANGESSMNFNADIYLLKFANKILMGMDKIQTWRTNSPHVPLKVFDTPLEGFAARPFYRVVTIVKPPFVYKNTSWEKPIYYGYSLDMIQDLADILAFDYEIYEAPDGKAGNILNEKGEYDGMTREIMDGRAHLGIGPIAIIAEREAVLEFSIPYYDMIGTVILMKLPYVPTNLFKFLSVLDDTVWGCIIAAFFITSFVMWVYDRLSPYSFQNNAEKYKDDDERRYFDFKECLWFCMTSLTPQGGGEAPRSPSGRLMAATWWLFGFIVIASYTANLAAFLTVSRLETPVSSLEDLSKQFKIKYSPLNNSESYHYFRKRAYIEDKLYEVWRNVSLDDTMNEYDRAQLATWDYPLDDAYTKIWRTMHENGMPNTLEEAIERVRNSTDENNYAFLGDAADIKYMTLLYCDLQTVGEEFSRKPYAVAMPKGSPMKDLMNDALLQLQNNRKMELYKEVWWNENPFASKCDKFRTEDTGGGISIENIGGVFIVILVGITLAFITLIFEYYYYRNRNLNEGRLHSEARIIEVKQAIAKINKDKATVDKEAESPTAYRRGIQRFKGRW